MASGVLAGKFSRKSTEKADWQEARAEAAAWEKAGSWIASTASAAPVTPEPPKPEKAAITIKFATDAYLANRAGRNIADSTQRKYRTMTTQLLTFSADKGYVSLDQLTVPDMDEFFASWKDGIRAKAKKLERLKGFFKFCQKRKWVKENPADDLEPPVGSSTPASKMPFTDPELVKIYEACDRMPTIRWENGRSHGEWGGEDVKLMIMLLVWTGLRISDGATFDMSRVTPHPKGGADILLRMKKTGKFKSEPLYTWVDDWLYQRLLARQRKHGSRIFATGESEKLETVTDLWRRKINRVFDLAAPFECGRPTPHIFRHTFVRLLLQSGVSPRDVAELIGDTEDMVLRHYARWVPERQERLTNILRKQLATAPRPKLAVIDGGRA
jgi:site-specific recombinase XerD